MNAMNVNDRIVNPAPAAPAVFGHGDDILRRRIFAELAEFNNQLPRHIAMINDDRIRSVAAWVSSFLKVLSHPEPGHYPNAQEILRQYAELLIEKLRGPGVPPGTPFPPEMYGDRAHPIIRFIVAKLRDPTSLFYSQRFDHEALRVLAPQLLEQLQQMEADNARQIAEEAQHMPRLQALMGRVNQRKIAHQERVDQAARAGLEAGQRIRDRAEILGRNDLEDREMIREAIVRERQEAENLRAETVQLERQLENTDVQVGQLQRAAVHLQVEINQLRSEIADKKSNWLEQVVCIAASIAVSWILEHPVIITPNGVIVGLQ